MSDYCILVADATRARLFTLEPATFPETESSPRLVEQQMDYVNPEESLSGEELWSNSKSGRNMATPGMAHGYDDHRTQHREEHTMHFAKQVAAQTIRHALDHHAKHLVVSAEKHMLGLMREALDIPAQSELKLVEINKDLTAFSPHEIHEHLAAQQVLPAMKRPGGASP